MAEIFEYTVADGDAGKRLDMFLAEKRAVPSRSFGKKLIDADRVQVNNQPAKASYKVCPGDRIRVVVPDPEPIEAQPEAINLDILYEDEDVIVINKPRGMVVHPAAGNRHGTLVNALLAHCTNLSGIGGKTRPGIVHRLDKDTTGVMMAAKNDRAHLSLAQQIKEKSAKRNYLAIVHGNVREDQGIIKGNIGRHPVHRKKMAVVPESRGKPAVTHYKVLERFGDFTLIEARLETGRTHQIRVHMAHLGHPVAGDDVYGPKRSGLPLKGQALHSARLTFAHPETGETVTCTAPLPEDFAKSLDYLRKTRKQGLTASYL